MEQKKENKNRQYKNGIVLSGGAYRGMGQVGALKALMERGIQPDVMSGTSAGALNAVLYVSGYSPEEMYDIWMKEPFGKALDLHFPKFGFMKHNKFGEMLKPYLRHERLEELPVPVFITASCLNTGEQTIFKSGDLVQLLEAACSVPLVFEPVEIDGRQYVDGGVVSNLPVEPLEGKCDRLIGISVNPIPEKENLDGLKEILYRTVWMGVEGTVKKTQKQCDWFIAPEELGRHGLVERSALDIFYQAGYEYTCHFLDEKGYL